MTQGDNTRRLTSLASSCLHMVVVVVVVNDESVGILFLALLLSLFGLRVRPLKRECLQRLLRTELTNVQKAK